MIRQLYLHVEEPSAKAALTIILPKIAPDLNFIVYDHKNKTRLLKELPIRLSDYATWLPEDSAVLVLIDRDNQDCTALKRQLEDIAAAAGLISKSCAAAGRRAQIVNRIVIEELEAWFFGDWRAVQDAYPRVPDIARKQEYRDPDAIRGGTWEALTRILNKSEAFGSRPPKITIAEKIAAEMDPDRNRSPSFQAFRDAVRDLCRAA